MTQAERIERAKANGITFTSENTMTAKCGNCGIEMIFTETTTLDGVYIYDHPGSCLDENGINRFDSDSATENEKQTLPVREDYLEPVYVEN